MPTGDGSGDFGRLAARSGAEVLVAQPVGVALQREDFGVVDEAVDHRHGDYLISEDLAPARERLVRGDDHAGALVAGGYQAEHEVGGFRVERYVAYLVDDEHRDERQAARLGVEAVLALGLGEPGHPLGGTRKGDPVAGEAGPDRDRDRKMRLARAGWAQRHDVLLRVQEVELAEVLDHLLLDRALEAEVELLERLARREAGSLDARLAAVGLAR